MGAGPSYGPAGDLLRPTSECQTYGFHHWKIRCLVECPAYSSVRLQMDDDDDIGNAVGLHLGVPLCCPHICHLCGAALDELPTQGRSCPKSHGCHPRHTTINEVIQRFLAAAGVPAQIKPLGICWSDGQRLDGAMKIPCMDVVES